MKTVRAWLAVWSGWTALALFLAASNSLTYVSTGRPANWALSIKRSVSEWWLWAALTPPVFWLARRFPLRGARLGPNIAVHVVAGAVVAIVKTVADRILFALLTGVWMYWLVSTLALNFVLYGVLVAAAHGVEYYRRSREREHLEARLAETRLQLLGMQLQPHFLFNTLNTIAEMVHEDPDKADTMIAGLSDLLRRSLDLGTVQQIPLSDEIDLVRRYLEIQKARFGDRLQVRLSIDDGALDARRAGAPAAAPGRERDPARPRRADRRGADRHRRALGRRHADHRGDRRRRGERRDDHRTGAGRPRQHAGAARGAIRIRGTAGADARGRPGRARDGARSRAERAWLISGSRVVVAARVRARPDGFSTKVTKVTKITKVLVDLRDLRDLRA